MKALAKILCIALILTSVVPVRAQEALDTQVGLAAANQEITRLSQSGSLAKAVSLAKRVLRATERINGKNHNDVGTSLNTLAGLYDKLGQYDKAEALYKRAIIIHEKTKGPNHPSVAESLNSLALIYRRNGRDSEAEPLLKRTLAILENTWGPNHAVVRIALSSLTSLYGDQERYDEAVPLYKREIAIRERVLGPEHRSIGTSLNNLALVYLEQGRFAEAEPLLKRSVEITRKALGPRHLAVGTALDNLAKVYLAKGRYFDAEPLLKRAIEIKTAARGANSVSVGKSLSNLALLYLMRRNYRAAEAHFKRAIAIDENTSDPNHRELGTSLANLGYLHLLMGRYKNAEQGIKRSLAIHERVLGPEHKSIGISLDTLGQVYLKQGRYADAEQLFERSFVIKKKALGSVHPEVGITLNNLAMLYYLDGRPEKSERLIRLAIRIYVRTLGPNHSEVRTSLDNLAKVYAKLGREVDEARVQARLRQMPPDGTRHLPVHVATTRKWSVAHGSVTDIEADAISYGRVTMQVPALAQQRLGAKRANSLGKLDRSREALTAAKTITRIRQRKLSAKHFVNSLKASMATSALYKKQVLVFVHGFNVDFDESAQRISQIAFDLEFDGALIAFSWPSLGSASPISYGRDRKRADRAVAPFMRFLDEISKKLPDVTVHILAHSMGNRVLTGAMARIADRPQGTKRPNLGEIILAHADVDPGQCERLGKVRPYVRGITSYVNRDDWALKVSRALRLGENRCGQLPRAYKGIQTIDTTGMGGKTTFTTLVLGGKNHHGVFANDPLLFGEITRLIASGQKPPHERTPELAKRKDPRGHAYWAYDSSLDTTVERSLAED